MSKTAVKCIAITAGLLFLSVVAVLASMVGIWLLALIVVASICAFGLALCLGFLVCTAYKDNISQRCSDLSLAFKAHPTPIDVMKAPLEVVSIVESLNEFLTYYEDRFQQERDFTADASHELRTPLAGIRVQTQLAMLSPEEKDRQMAHKNILKAVDRGTRLVEQLLILSRLTMDKVDLEMDTVSIIELCAQVVNQWQPEASKKNIHLALVIEDDIDGYISASWASLELLFDNLIKNALKFTPSEGEVLVSIRQGESGGCVVEVADNGPGIPEADYEKVFKRFQKSEHGAKSGTGLGLAIVKRIVELHQATIELRKTSPSTGLTVVLQFDLAPDEESLQVNRLIEKIQKKVEV